MDNQLFFSDYLLKLNQFFSFHERKCQKNNNRASNIQYYFPSFSKKFINVSNIHLCPLLVDAVDNFSNSVNNCVKKSIGSVQCWVLIRSPLVHMQIPPLPLPLNPYHGLGGGGWGVMKENKNLSVSTPHIQNGVVVFFIHVKLHILTLQWRQRGFGNHRRERKYYLHTQVKMRHL